MSKVDWSLAPEGATHFLPAKSESHCDVWFKMDRGYAVSAGYDRENGWAHSYTKDCQPSTDMTRLISRKDDEHKPWSGPEDGLPPVNTVCEVKGCISHYLRWNKVTVFAVRGKTVMFDMEDGRWGQTDSHEFRAIQTPEQLRETAIREIMDVADVDCRVTAARLVDAGFKREACKSDCSTNNRGVPELLGPCDFR